MGVQNVVPPLVNPTPSDDLADPSHSLSEHSVENDYITWLANTFRARTGTDPGIVNLRGVSVGGVYANGDRTTNDATYVQAACDLLGANGGMVIAPPGQYRLGTGITVTNKGSIWFVALSAKKYTAHTNGASAQPQGTSFVIDAGLTGFTFTRTSGAEMVNSGPKFTGFGFEAQNAKQVSRTITAATFSGTTGTFTVGSGHGFVNGDVIFVKNTYPADSSSVYNGRFTVASTTSTTVVATLGSTPSGNATTFGTMHYDVIPASGVGVDINDVSRWAFEDCMFMGLTAGIQVDPSATNDSDQGRVTDSAFVGCATGLLLSGGGDQGVTVDNSEFHIGRNQTGIDIVQRAENVQINNPKIRIGLDTSGDQAVGINVRKGGEFGITDPRIYGDVRVGTAYGIKVGQAGKTIGTIMAPKAKGVKVEGRKLVGIRLNGLDASNPTHGVQIIGPQGNALYRGIEMGQYAKGNTVLGGGFTDCERGVLLEAGSTGNLVAMPTGSIDAMGGSKVVEDLGVSNQVLFERDVAASTYGFMDLIKSDPPISDAPAGHSLLYATPTGELAMVQDDNTIDIISGGGGGGGGGGGMAPPVAQLLGPLEITASGDTTILSYTIPANYVEPGWLLQIIAWGTFATDGNAQPTLATKLLTGGTQRLIASQPADINQSSAYWRTESTVACRNFSGASSQNAGLTGSLIAHTAVVSGTTNLTKGSSSFWTQTNGVSTGFALALAMGLSIASPAGSDFIVEHAAFYEYPAPS